MKLGELTRLGWTWQGPVEVQDPVTGPHFEIRIRELPEYFAAGATREEAMVAAVPALRAFLQSYLDNGEQPPMPADARPAWVVRKMTMPPQRTIPTIKQSGATLTR